MPGVQLKEASEVMSEVGSHSVSCHPHLTKTLNSYLEHWQCDNAYVQQLKTQWFISYNVGICMHVSTRIERTKNVEGSVSN